MNEWSTLLFMSSVESGALFDEAHCPRNPKPLNP